MKCAVNHIVAICYLGLTLKLNRSLGEQVNVNSRFKLIAYSREKSWTLKAPLKNYHNDLDAVADRITQKTKLIFITNPHNPTGCVTTRKEVERFLLKVPEHVVVVMDEAYFDYAESSDYPNSIDYMNGNCAVIGLRTFSKLAGLAGARIGYAMAEPELVGCLKRVVQPYGICCLSQAAALASLDDDEHLQKVLELNRAGREASSPG